MEAKTYRNVMVVMEQREGVVQPVSLELLGKARELADVRGQDVVAVVPGRGIEPLADTAVGHGADRVVVIDDDVLEPFTSEPYTKAVVAAIETETPEIVLFGATAIGRDLAPRVAARIYTGLTADCTALSIDPETQNLLMTRPAFGGNIMATIICPDRRPQMSTVRPGVMVRPDFDARRTGEVVKLDLGLSAADRTVEVLAVVKADDRRVNIEDAKVLVSAGRGLGNPRQLDPIYTLAGRLSGEVSGSRAVIDAGWLEKDRQVGQTGKTVRPGVYMALGISGQIQHLAGMEESEFIVAVNKDPDAPIFDVADIGVVGDATKIVPAVLAELGLAPGDGDGTGTGTGDGGPTPTVDDGAERPALQEA